jgi:hypothetical protein
MLSALPSSQLAGLEGVALPAYWMAVLQQTQGIYACSAHSRSWNHSRHRTDFRFPSLPSLGPGKRQMSGGRCQHLTRGDDHSMLTGF